MLSFPSLMSDPFGNFKALPGVQSIQGSICKAAKKIFNHVGLEIHPEAYQNANHVSGGHAVIRSAVNAGIKGSYDRTRQLALDMTGILVVVNVGDKIMKTTGWLN